MIAYLNLDEVIKIIRTHDDPKKQLIKNLNSLKFRQTLFLIFVCASSKLEEQSIIEERDSLKSEAKEIEKILNSASRLKTLIKKELKEDQEEFGDERNSMLAEAEEAKAFDEKELISNDPMTVVLSEKGLDSGSQRT